MAEILNTEGVYLKIKDVIKRARKYVILVSPYLDPNNDILQMLENLDRQKSVPIFVLCSPPNECGWIEKQQLIMTKLDKIDGCDVHTVPDLHAKLYCNESEMVITSMNLYNASRDNFELGVYLTKLNPQDITPFENALIELNDICRAAQPQMNRVQADGTVLARSLNGHCILCNQPTVYNETLNDDGNQFCPTCRERFFDSQKHSIVLDTRYCHKCGKQKEKSSYDIPFCRKCWKEIKDKMNLY